MRILFVLEVDVLLILAGRGLFALEILSEFEFLDFLVYGVAQRFVRQSFIVVFDDHCCLV